MAKRNQVMLFQFPKFFDSSNVHLFSMSNCSFKRIGQIWFISILFLLISSLIPAQNINVGSFQDNDIRSSQLLGDFDSSYSLTVRPIQLAQKISWKKPSFSLLPVSIIQQYNSHHPYGWNDGSMIAAKGYQALVTAGFRASYGAFNIQVQPEFVTTTNPGFEANPSYGETKNAIFRKLYMGQSDIQTVIGKVSFGLSTMNLWWGPGIRSSLLMSNNAPGFLHGYFKSNAPIKTGIGDFEWQLIGGKLTSDTSQPYENTNLKKPVSPYNPDWRYLSAYVISYHPKWVPGLFLGMTRSIQRYHKDLQLSSSSFLNQYIPVITKAFQKSNAQGDDTLNTDQLASFFFRWVLPKAKSEFYVEWGYNDYGQNIRDYLMTPTHSAAYIVGFKKVFPLKDSTFLDFGFELTQMSQSPDYILREAGNWYTHGQISQGYTNENQILGAGAGLGSNVQSLTTTWVNGWKKIGILLERVERDPQYHVNKWTDYSIGFLPQWKYDQIVLSGIFQFVNSTNYAWEEGKNRFNFHARLAFTYLF